MNGRVRVPFWLEWKECEVAAALVVAPGRAVREEQHRAGHEGQADEDLKYQHFHGKSFFPSSRTTSPIETIDDTGMRIAARSGDMSPARDNPSAMLL